MRHEETEARRTRKRVLLIAAGIAIAAVLIALALRSLPFLTMD